MRPPFTFFGTMRLTGNFEKNFKRKIRKFFSSIFIFLRAFVVSSCRKSGFRVFLSLRYGAGLFIISAVAGILLKSQKFNFFSVNSCRDTEKFRYFVRQLV